MRQLALFVLMLLAGCAHVSSIQHPLVLAANTCEFESARAGVWPWDPQQCLTICNDGGKELNYFAGCSSEGGLISGVKSAIGVIPTIPITGP